MRAAAACVSLIFIKIACASWLCSGADAFSGTSPSLVGGRLATRWRRSNSLQQKQQPHQDHNTQSNYPGPCLYAQNDQGPNNNGDKGDEEEGILSRFTNPRIDDLGLPLSDALVSQTIAPSLQVAWLALNHAPSPTWLIPFFESPYFASRGALVAPALLHGAALAVCWLVGALAARAYEIDGLVPDRETKSYAPVITRVLKAGAFATGLLIFATQTDLFLEFGGNFVQYGDGEQSDFRIQVAAVELVNDVFFEAISILTWRLFLAVQTERNSGFR